ncbi:MAG: hypothetical protein PHQ98_00835 [Candidatus ainarchaeum sp.]|nr:hypothetical protein [Candidatus ainarchaeum sp.]
MATITLSVPDDLKIKMDKTDWVNWSSVARKAFASTLIDLQKLELMKKIEEISEINENDNREIKDDVIKEIISKANYAENQIRQKKRKLMSPNEFKSWCDKL